MVSIIRTLTLHSALWISLHAGSDIASMMDPTVDPCVDFYSFACGKYNKEKKLADDKTDTSLEGEMDDRATKQLRELLETSDQPSDTRSALMAKRYYRSCMDEKALEKIGLDPLLKILKAFGGMPVLEGQNWTENGYDWVMKNVRMYRELGMSPIIVFGVGADHKNASAKLFQIHEAGLLAGHRDYYLDKSHSNILEALKKFMVGTMIQLGAQENDAKQAVDEIIRFETDLAKIKTRPEDLRDAEKLYNPMTVSAVKSAFPELHLDKWFSYMAQNGLVLKDTEMVDVAGMPYLKQLGDVLKKHSNRTIANYQMWNAAMKYYDYLAPSLRKHWAEYRTVLYGTSKMPDRWEECVGSVNGAFDWPLGALYVRKHFPQSSKEEVDKMVAFVRNALKTTIEQADWMDQSTKSKALEKLETMQQKIGYPNNIYNETWLLEGREGVEISENQYLENYDRISRAAIAHGLREFRKPANRSEWDTSPETVNAFYDPQNNEILFPAAYLQYAMFDSSAPHFQNYGRVGYIIGHEITHGYDDRGRQFDSKGNLVGWWTDQTLKKFEQGAKCFIDQYSKIKNPIAGMNINGELTIGENIADNGGLKLAYKAYQLWKNASITNGGSATDIDRPTEPELSKYTSDQLFFLALGQTSCNVIRPEALRRQIIADTHAPLDARITVPLQNFEAFAEAFKCPVGSPMNPKEKCSIW